MSWDSLPSEILKLIASKCGRNCKNVKWMFVNKKWFNIYLSLTYKTISIDSKTTDNKVDKILFSPFDVGNYVKDITFKSFHIASKIEELDMTGDCLSMLMKHTPNVEKVAFASDTTFDSTAWTYFSSIIISNEYWRLHVLPEPTGKYFAFPAQYYLCACHMRESLKMLNITLGMIGPRNYRCLVDFTAVETLCIEKGILAGLYGLDLILPHLPKLKSLTAYFSDKHMDSHQNEQEEQKIYTYPNLKELTLNNFTPKKDGEMLTLIKNLTHLKKLNIIGDEKALWPSDTVDPTITGIFFDTFSLVPEYLIEVTGKSQVTALMNKWSRVKKKTSQEIHLSFKFNSGNIQPISLAIEESSSNPIIRLRYKGLAHSEEFNSFIWIGDTVSKVEYIDSSMNNRGIAERIIALLGEEHVNLKTLILTNCVFTFNTFPNTLPPEKQHLKKLEFCNCTFDLPVLMSFLTQFDSLDFVGFGYCIFKSIIYDEPINMSKTSIGTMRISNPTCEEKVRSNNRSNHRLVTNCNTNYQTHVRAASVYSSAENLTRFYIIIDDNAVEATQASFNSILTQFKLNITVIRLKVYFIEELLLKSVNSSGYIEIISPD